MVVPQCGLLPEDGHADAIRVLAENGADVNTPDKNG